VPAVSTVTVIGLQSDVGLHGGGAVSPTRDVIVNNLARYSDIVHHALIIVHTLHGWWLRMDIDVSADRHQNPNIQSTLNRVPDNFNPCVLTLDYRNRSTVQLLLLINLWCNYAPCGSESDTVE